ncbi:PcfJ domain-containing protein [Bacillus subtilis]|uniref:PcfJ domain-containing protein n=1 Tax=Bacillus subtilis TaxID=1423 RepID=UPI000F529BEF
MPPFNRIDTKNEIKNHYHNFLPDYKFELAESDLQIYQVGHKFNNCLGGYVDEAMEQRVFILFLRNKVTEEIEYAMEVSPNKVLYQAEGKYKLKLIIVSLVSIVLVVLIL